MLLDRTFTSQTIGEIIGVEPKHIQNWANRGLIVGQSEGGKGKARRYTFTNLIAIAVALELMVGDIDLGPEAAFASARRIAEVGGPVAAVRPGQAFGPIRQPGLPFHHKHGVTFLIVGRDNTRTSVQLVNENETFLNVAAFDGRRGMTVVNISAVFKWLCERMDPPLDALKELDAAYPDDSGA